MIGQFQYLAQADTRVTTCLENLEMLGNLTDVREISGKTYCQLHVSS